MESASIKIAGDKFDEAVIKYIRKKHNVLIGDRTAEELKMTIGCVFPRPEEVTMEIKGRCLMTGLPRVFSVSSSEMIEAFEEVTSRILEAIHGVLERTPPELVADISTNGIVMTGGAAPCCGALTSSLRPTPASRPTWPRTPSPAWPRAPARAWTAWTRCRTAP